MTIEYKDSKRIVTSATSATSVQGYSTLSAGNNGWSVGTGAADGTLLSLQVVSGSALIGDPIQNIKVTIYKNLSPDQLVYVRVRNSSDTILAEASKQASTLAGSATEYVFTLNTAVILSALDRVNVEYYGANGTGTVGIEVLNNAGTSTVNCQRDTATAGVYTDIARRPSWQFDSSPSTTISILQDKPTDVQDNSILIEKDTAKRYWASVIGNTGLKAYYKFDNASGNLVNQAATVGSSSSNGVDMVNTNVTLNQTGLIGKSYLYSATDTSNDGSASTNWEFTYGSGAAFTVVGWYKQTGASEIEQCPLFDTSDSGNGLGSLVKVNGSNGNRQVSCKFHNGSASEVLSTATGTFPSDTNWHFIAMRATLNGGAVKFTIDGSTTTTTSSINGADGTANSRMGIGNIYRSTSIACRGNLDELSFWDRILTDAEVTALYNSGSGQAVGVATWTRGGFKKLLEQTTDGWQEAFTDVNRVGQRFVTGSSLIGGKITKVLVRLKIHDGSPSGTITCRIRDSSDNIKLTLGTSSASSLSSDYQDVSYENLDGYVLADQDKVCIEYPADTSNTIQVGVINSNVLANSSEWYYTNQWFQRATYDMYFKIYGFAA